MVLKDQMASKVINNIYARSGNYNTSNPLISEGFKKVTFKYLINGI